MSRNIPNSFQLPNAIIDDYLAEMPWHATKCYLFIVRKTRGWQKDSDYISLSQFMDGTGISRSSVYEALSWLEGKKLIARVKGKSVRNMAEYTLVNDPDEPSAPTDTNPATVRPHGLNRPPPRNNNIHSIQNPLKYKINLMPEFSPVTVNYRRSAGAPSAKTL